MLLSIKFKFKWLSSIVYSQYQGCMQENVMTAWKWWRPKCSFKIFSIQCCSRKIMCREFANIVCYNYRYIMFKLVIAWRGCSWDHWDHRLTETAPNELYSIGGLQGKERHGSKAIFVFFVNRTVKQANKCGEQWSKVLGIKRTLQTFLGSRPNTSLNEYGDDVIRLWRIFFFLGGGGQLVSIERHLYKNSIISPVPD